jgi:peptide chain release factor 1
MKQDKELILSLSKKKGDFIVKTSRSSGPGGQNVNKRETNVEVIHPASGATGRSQTHRTQEKNRREAFKRLSETPKFKTWLRIELAKRGLQTGVTRQETHNTERVRTYHFPRDEVVDHQSGLKVGGVKDVLDGKIDSLIESVKLSQEKEMEDVGRYSTRSSK